MHTHKPQPERPGELDLPRKTSRRKPSLSSPQHLGFLHRCMEPPHYAPAAPLHNEQGLGLNHFVPFECRKEGCIYFGLGNWKEDWQEAEGTE